VLIAGLPCLALSSMRDARMAEILGASLRIMAGGWRGRERVRVREGAVLIAGLPCLALPYLVEYERC
jgi:hypothetical protein